MSNPHPTPRYPSQIYWDKAWLLTEYQTNRRSAVAIAAECGCTTDCIYFWLGRHDIPRRGLRDAARNRYAMQDSRFREIRLNAEQSRELLSSADGPQPDWFIKANEKKGRG